MNKHEVALHEAGHCIVAHRLGKTYYGAALQGDGFGKSGAGDLSQRARMEDYTLPKLAPRMAGASFEESFNDAVVYTAGCVAVAMATFAPATLITGADRNLCEAACRSAMPDIDHHGVEHFAGLAASRARCILRERWPAVELVATELERRGSLTAAEVAELIARAP